MISQSVAREHIGPTSSILNIPTDYVQTWETRPVLKKVAQAHRYLAEFKGVARTIPNEAILISTLTLQ